MPSFKLKAVVLFLKILVSLVLSRNEGNIIQNISQNCTNVNVDDLR